MPSSLPAITSASNCRSHASASNAENHSRNGASSSGWRALTCPSIRSTRLIKFSSTISAPANWPPGMLDGRRRAPSHPSLTAVRLQSPPGLELQDGDDVGSVDGGLVFRAFVIAERSLVGLLTEDVEPGLHRGIDAEFQDAHGCLSVESHFHSSCHAALSLPRQNLLYPDPRVRARFGIRLARIGSFARAHETVTGAFIRHRLVGFACLFHIGDGIRNGRADARIKTCVESVYGRFDTAHGVLLGRRSVEHQGGGNVRAIRREAEGLPTSPAEARHEKLLGGGRQFQAVIGHRVEVGGDLVGIEMTDRLHNLARLETGHLN